MPPRYSHFNPCESLNECVHVCLYSIYTHMSIMLGGFTDGFKVKDLSQPLSLEELQMFPPAERSNVRTRPAAHGQLWKWKKATIRLRAGVAPRSLGRSYAYRQQENRHLSTLNSKNKIPTTTGKEMGYPMKLPGNISDWATKFQPSETHAALLTPRTARKPICIVLNPCVLVVILYGNNRKWMKSIWCLMNRNTRHHVFRETWTCLGLLAYWTPDPCRLHSPKHNVFSFLSATVTVCLSFLLSKCQMICLGWLIFILTGNLSWQHYQDTLESRFCHQMVIKSISQQILKGILLPLYGNAVFLPVVFSCCTDPCFQNLYVFQDADSIPCLLWSSVP